jgi:hypothetical protein
MGRIIAGFLSWVEVGWHGLVISVANGRSKSACSGFARKGAKAQSLFLFYHGFDGWGGFFTVFSWLREVECQS